MLVSKVYLHFYLSFRLLLEALRETCMYVLTFLRELRLFLSVALTKPYNCNPEALVQIVCVTGKKDKVKLVLGIKTFLYFAGNNFSLKVFDDGTLNLKDCQFIYSHLPGVKIIKERDYLNKLKIDLPDFYNKEIIKNSWSVKKKVGPLLFSANKKLLFLDSDILFFKKPVEILRWLKKENDIIYMADFQNAYPISRFEAKYYFKTGLLEKVNSGIVGLNHNDMDPKLLEKIIIFLSQEKIYGLSQIQIYFALLFNKIKSRRRIRKLPLNYLVGDPSKNIDPNKCTSVHYAGLVRDSYYAGAKYALKLIRKAKV